MPLDIATNNKRLMHNTLMLYLRMFILMGISLYTSRVILEALGVEDYGIYNVVGGIVVLFVFINNAMVSATQRFLNFELGRQNLSEMSRVFSMSLNVHILIAILIVILGETIGLYLFYNYIKIPQGREVAAQIVFQLSIVATAISIIRAPYNAVVIAYERMSVYAYISVFEAFTKLAIAFALLYYGGDKLILYALLILGVTLCVSLFYYVYDRIKFPISKYIRFWDKDLFKRLTSFSGWSMFGSISLTGAYQAVSIVQNYYGGVLVNAAMAIANQVSGAVSGFSGNFQMAFNPQITKYYAAEEYDNLRRLTYMATKTSFFLVWIFALPIIVSCQSLLQLWLNEVPEYSVKFCQWIMLCSIFDAISAPLWMNVYATGKIKTYQIYVSIIILLNLPLSIIVLHFGLPAESVLIVRFAILAFLFFYRSLYLKRRNFIQFGSYLREAILPIIIVSILSTLVSIVIISMFDNYIIRTIGIFILSIFIIILMGFNRKEKRSLLGMVLRKQRCKV